MKSRTCLPLVALLLLTVCAIGLFTIAPAQPLFTLDAAAFQQKDGLVYLEVYLMIQRSGLKFTQVDSTFQAPIDIILDLRTQDSLLSSTPWQVLDKVASLEEITPKQKLPDIAIFPQLQPGKYTLIGKVRDVNRDTTYIRLLELNLKSIGDSSLAVSDLELATRLEKTESKNKFSKNGFLVVPNPEHLYGLSLPMLYYYAEIYNLKSGEGVYTVDRVIVDEQGKEIKKLPIKSHQKVGASVVEVDGFSVAALRSGSYHLTMTVVDSAAGDTARARTRFFVFRPEDFSRASKGGQLTPDEQAIMDSEEPELNSALDGIKFLLSDGEWRSLETLTLDGKRRFLVSFWKSHDSDTTTAVNEFKQTYEARKRVAGERFGYFNRAGWQTDRGRIFILYGSPDHIDVHTHDMETRPYEIWNYDAVEGGVYFVFVDHSNFGDYRLVHSTKNGELSRPNWFDQEAAIQRK